MSHIAIMGHNNPPTEVEVVKQRLEDYTDEAARFAGLSGKIIPAAIESDEQAGEISDHIKAVDIFWKSIESIHEKEKKPYWDAGKACDEWKNKYKTKIDAVAAKARPVLLAWNQKKAEAERLRQLEIARLARLEAEKLAAEAEAHANEGIMDTAEELIEAAIQSEQKADMIQSSALQVKVKSVGSYSSSGIKKEWTGIIESLAAIDLEALRPYLKEEDILAALKRAVKDGKRNIRGAKIYPEDKLSTR